VENAASVEALSQARGEVAGDPSVLEVEAFEGGQLVSGEWFDRSIGDAGSGESEEPEAGVDVGAEQFFDCPVVDGSTAIQRDQFEL